MQMEEVIKYLELIRNSIELRNKDILEIQIKKIKELNMNNEVIHLVSLLDRNQFNLGSILIDKIILEEREIQRLKSEYKELESKLHYLSQEKSTLLYEINNFNTRYYKELGHLVKKILHIKKSILKMQITNLKTDNQRNLYLAYDEAVEVYKRFSFLLKEEEEKQPQVLSKIEKIILNDTYSKAIKLCHPDMLCIEMRNSVDEIFTELNSAYLQNNLELVKKIKKNLENRNNDKQISFKRMTKEELKTLISKIKRKIGEKKLELTYLLNNETYHRIEKENRDGDYFIRTKELLKLELMSLQEKLEIQENQEYLWMQILWNWAEKENITTFPSDKESLLNLTMLDISHKNLTKLPDELSKLNNLTILNISHNQLTQLPYSIVKLRNLIYLNISNNNLIRLPKNIGKLHKLEVLDLEENKLIKLPSSISTLTNLTQLKLSFNQLTTLPESITNLENLRGLFLKGNKLK
jgi:hypothetical protein